MENNYRLKKNDLNNFKLEINKKRSLLIDQARLLNNAKAEYYKKAISKEELLEFKKQYQLTKEDFNSFIKNNDFFVYYNEVKAKLQQDKKNQQLIEEYKYAKNLYVQSKRAIKDKGSTASVEKVNDVAVSVKNLSYRYKQTYPYVLKDVSFDIMHGEYIAVIGHNGSGKSTLSKLLIGVLRADQGSIEIYGNLLHPSTVKYVRKFIGSVFQNPDNQFIGSTVQDDIAFGLENYRVPYEEMQKRVIEAATKVGMEKFLDHEPLMLSGGQKQRVAIASTLALMPEIIIFDEATSMLDPKGKSEIKKIMLDLRASDKKTIISITHDMDEILGADRIIVMNGGEIVFFDKPENVLKNKELLKSIKLDMPFVTLVEEELQSQGINIAEGSNNIDELVDKICQI